MNIKNNSARIKYLASVLEETFQVFQQEALVSNPASLLASSD
jgi:hypothetical protein